jgi:hypothetical protein
MYIQIKENEKIYPFSEWELKKQNPQVSFPNKLSAELLEEFGVFPFIPVPMPTTDYTKVVTEAEPQLINDEWHQSWTIRDATEHELNEYFKAIKDGIIYHVQQRLDEFAQTRNYDNILSLCSYATDSDLLFRKEGEFGVEIRSQTWRKCYQILDEIESGTRVITEGYTEIEQELPATQWPF